MWSRLFQSGQLIDEPFPRSKELKSFHNAELNRAVLKTIKVVKEIRSLKTRIGMKANSRPLIYIDATPSQVPEISSMKSHIENLARCTLTCGSLPPLERSSFITVIIQLDGQICKISTPKVYLKYYACCVLFIYLFLGKLYKLYYLFVGRGY